MSALRNKTVEGFVAELASSSPAPGGGSAAALSGALGAALISMVCRLTIGKKGYEAFEKDAEGVLERSDLLWVELVSAIDRDAEAFDRVMEAFRLPKGSDDEKTRRAAAIQIAFREACESPRNTALKSLEVLRLCALLLGRVNVNAVSDLGVAAASAHTGLEGALMNVAINLPSIKDETYTSAAAEETARWREEGEGLKGLITRSVEAILSGR